MKNTILTVASLLSFLIAPAPAFALFNVNQGGTGQSTFSSGALLYGNGTSPIATTAAGTLGYVLQFNGTFPTWVSPSSRALAAGSDGQIQINNSGNLSGDPRLSWGNTGGGDGLELTIGGRRESPSSVSMQGSGRRARYGSSIIIFFSRS